MISEWSHHWIDKENDECCLLGIPWSTIEAELCACVIRWILDWKDLRLVNLDRGHIASN